MALGAGPGSLNVTIGGKPAWRGVPSAVAQVLQIAKKVVDTVIQVAESATKAAAGPAAPAAYAAEQTLKGSLAIAMGQAITASACGADIHVCATPVVVPPHGPGVVIDGSTTVTINGLPAARAGDTILEALGPPNKIAFGCLTVTIGG